MAVENTPIDQSGVSRRSFAKGAAWAAPVVAVAVSAPVAAAASAGSTFASVEVVPQTAGRYRFVITPTVGTIPANTSLSFTQVNQTFGPDNWSVPTVSPSDVGTVTEGDTFSPTFTLILGTDAPVGSVRYLEVAFTPAGPVTIGWSFLYSPIVTMVPDSGTADV